MNLLALDTSTPRAALALGTSSGADHYAAPDPSQRHGRNLVPALHDLLRAAGLRPGDLDGIVVGLGPGSYTGLRIGLTAAKMLAYALGKPLAGLDSLELVAQNAPRDVLCVVPIADAQRGDLYTSEFRREGPGESLVRVRPTQIEAQELWKARLSPGSCIVGPGLDRLRSSLPEGVIASDPDTAWPDPEHLLALARRVWASGRRDDPWVLEPLYLRKSAAEDQWEQKMLGDPRSKPG